MLIKAGGDVKEERAIRKAESGPDNWIDGLMD